MLWLDAVTAGVDRSSEVSMGLAMVAETVGGEMMNGEMMNGGLGQHVLGLVLAGYLVGFSIAYARSLARSLDARRADEAPALTWPQALVVVLRLIPPGLLWLWPRR